MQFSNPYSVVVNGGSFTDIQGNINHFYTAEAGIFQLKNAISTGASHDSIERFPPPKCHPETREAVLKCINQWIQDSDSGNDILWLHGPAGAGKSAIAQTIAEQTDGKELAATFFFSRGKPGRDTANLLWATIAFHLAQSIPDLRDKIGNAVVHRPDVVQKALDIQRKTLIIDPFTSVAKLPSSSPFLVVIDGLDECNGDDPQCDILKSIAEFIDIHRLPLRFLIASRPEPHIRSSFDTHPLQQYSFRLCLDEAFHPVQDVHNFLRLEFDRIYEKHQNTMGSINCPWPSQNIVQLLASRSSGQFIYASTVLRFIDDVDCRPTDQLRIVLTASGSVVFTELDQLYQQILSACNNRTLLLRILGCLAVACEPLSACVVEALLSLRDGDVPLVLRRLHSILDVPSCPTEPIRILHASFLDFIFDQKRSGKYSMIKSHCHVDMANYCVKYRAQYEKRREVLMDDGVGAPHYYSKFWTSHCRIAEPEGILPWLISWSESIWSKALDGPLETALTFDCEEFDYGEVKMVIEILLKCHAKGTLMSHDILRCPFNVVRHKILLLIDKPWRQCLPIFFTMFERLQMTWVEQFCNIDIYCNAMAPLSLSCLEEMGDLSYQDNLVLYASMKEKAQDWQYVMHVHARLALACIAFIERFANNLDYPVVKYARQYWAKHLYYSSTDNRDLGYSLRCLTNSFFWHQLDPKDAHFVLIWLRTWCDPPLDLISQWEAIAKLQIQTGATSGSFVLPVPWPEQQSLM